MKRLLMIGGGGFAKEVLEIAELNGYEAVGYLADSEGVLNAPYLGMIEEIQDIDLNFDEVVISFAAVDRKGILRRRNIIAHLESYSFKFATLISPNAVVSKGVKIGSGCVVAHGVVISVDAEIGEHVVLNTSAIIGHDTVIGDRTIVAPGAFIAGVVDIGSDCLLGPKSMVLQGRKVGDGAIVSLGASVLRNLAEGMTVLPNSSKTIE